eukprot:scaffold2059_cov33-Attheya_sp.AAC.3
MEPTPIVAYYGWHHAFVYTARPPNIIPTIMPVNPYNNKKRSTAVNKAASTPPSSLPSKHTSSMHLSIITSSPNPTPHSFTFDSKLIASNRPFLRQMILDFRTSVSDNRGHGSYMPANIITSIIDMSPTPTHI